MATRNEIAQLYGLALAAYPMTANETPQSVATLLDVWVLVLEDIPVETLHAAVTQRLCEPREWRPAPGMIRDTAIDLMGLDHPLPHEASGCLDDPLARRVYDSFEWWEWKDEPVKTKSRFERAYREALDRERKRVRQHPAAVKAIEHHETLRLTHDPLSP